MQGRTPWLGIPLLALALGCSDARPQSAAAPERPTAAPATDFDAAVAGSVEGQVAWDGDLPSVPPFDYRRNLPASHPPDPRLVRENPNAPTVDPGSRRVAGAVVFLRDVEARHAKPWDQPPVRIEYRARRLFVIQGDIEGRIGFVRRGQSVEMVSREPDCNVLRGSGAAFFSLTFPDPDRPRRRALGDNGLVELSSGAGYYWMRAYLFVTEHPYYARTDAAGHFRLPQVPPGRYQLVCWMPNWHVDHHDRDPETTVITRVFFQAPVVQERPVAVRPGATSTTDFTVSSALFGPVQK